MTTPSVVIDLVGSNVYAALADIIPRVTLFPYLASFWLGGQWAWALVVTLVYHLVVALPLRLLTTDVGVNAFPLLEILSKSNLFIQYFIAMMAMAIVSALSGYLVSFLFIMPRHLVPLSHTFTCCWGQRVIGDAREKGKDRIAAEINVPVPDGYKAYSIIVMAGLTVLGSFIPYEVLAWMYPGGGGSIVAVCMCIIPPVWSVGVSLVGFYAFNVENLFGYDADRKAYMQRAGLAVAKIAIVHTVPSVAVYLVTYFRRNYHVAWLTFFCGDALVLGVALFYYIYYGKKVGLASVEYLPGMETEEEVTYKAGTVRLLGAPFSKDVSMNTLSAV